MLDLFWELTQQMMAGFAVAVDVCSYRAAAAAAPAMS
jgi:hypothetical protein